MRAPAGHLVDATGTLCQACGLGRYVELSGFDDICGFLHCNRCGTSIARWTDAIALNTIRDDRRG
jgi:hypothetical protein